MFLFIAVHPTSIIRLLTLVNIIALLQTTYAKSLFASEWFGERRNIGLYGLVINFSLKVD